MSSHSLFESDASCPPTAFQLKDDAESSCRAASALIRGEKNIEEIREVYAAYVDGQTALGALHLTSYAVAFVPLQGDPTIIPLMSLVRVAKLGGKKSNEPYGIELFTKDPRYHKFFMDSHKKQKNSRKGFVNSIRDQFRRLSPNDLFFCFSNEECVGYPPEFDGWKLYDAEREFVRQGAASRDSPWHLLSQTQDGQPFGICDTYPEMVMVPKKITFAELAKAAAFRSRARFPALCWYHKTKSSALLRSSQPLSGLRNKQGKEDQMLLEAAAEANCTEGRELLIMDLRPRANAMANIAKGAGYENVAHYKRCKLKFVGIENINVMRDSYKKLHDLCTGNRADGRWLQNLYETGWMEHIRGIVESAREVSEALDEGYSVLVHCSDGWDRTSQISSLSQLLIDPYYRTIAGFAVLVEKEWLTFGHRFNLRCGHAAYQEFWAADRGPIFAQFLECVYQLIQQFPVQFEFTEHLLVFLMHHVYSCRFGTFLHDSERERRLSGVRDSTPSVWTYVLGHRALFQNPLYVPNPLCVTEPPRARPAHDGSPDKGDEKDDPAASESSRTLRGGAARTLGAHFKADGSGPRAVASHLPPPLRPACEPWACQLCVGYYIQQSPIAREGCPFDRRGGGACVGALQALMNDSPRAGGTETPLFYAPPLSPRAHTL